MNRRICFVSSLHKPKDVRVFQKQCVSLAREGFDVVHVAPGIDSRYELNNVVIREYVGRRGLAGRIVQILRLYQIAMKEDAACYHCNEIDSWLIGIMIKLTRGRRVVFDVHEDYPKDFAQMYFPKFMQPLITLAIRLLYLFLTPVTDGICIAKRFVERDFHCSKKKLILVRNFSLRPKRDRPIKVKRGPVEGRKFKVIHTGLISRVRGWPQLLDALAMTENDNIHLDVVGRFNDGSEEEFRTIVKKLKLESRVTVTEWMPYSKVSGIIRTADIGLVVFQPGYDNHVGAMPHKMFDYMQAGLPVVIPDFAVEIDCIVSALECGISVPTDQPKMIASALDRIIQDKDLRNRMGQNGFNGVIDTYNWEVEVGRLIAFYRRLLRA